MRRLLLLLLLTCFSCQLFAQSRIIKGRVTDETGQPMPGVTVTLKNTQRRGATAQDGTYSLNAGTEAGNLLTFSFIGYQPMEVDISGKTTVDVKMEPVASGLSEVVITALNISRSKASLGVSQQSVNVDEMTQARATNITDLLAGKVAGLQLTTSGQQTGSTRLVLRGPGSISGDNQPLWVVDGVPIDNYDGQNGNGNPNQIDYGNGAQVLNPDDIESIEVLKGPNAAALYGSRAANGALLVTTKKGKKNAGVGISVNENFMQGQILQFPEFQNIYGEGTNSSIGGTRNNNGFGVIQEGSNQRSWGGPLLGQPYASFSGAPITYSPHPDNITSLYQKAYTLTQNFSISNATETANPKGGPGLLSSYRFSYTRTDGNDVMELQNLQTRNNIAFNGSKDFTSFLKIDARLQYQRATVNNRIARNDDASNPMNTFFYLPRSVGPDDFIPWKDAAGNEFVAGNIGLENPYWLIHENANRDRNNTIIGGITATLKLLPGLQFRGQASTNMNWGDRQILLQKGAASNGNGKDGRYTTSLINNANYNYEGLFLYNKQLKNFSLLGNLGGNIRLLNNNTITSQITTLLGHSTIDEISLANNGGLVTSTERPLRSKIYSVFGTASIGYKNFVYLDLTGRNDWSSTLPLANGSFFYPSASTSFVFTELFHIPQNILSFGKVRASIATVGNDTSPYNLTSLFGYNGAFNGSPLVSFDQLLKNQDLKPEKSTSIELGTELQFLKNRISLDASVYRKTTTNQILQIGTSTASGYSNRVINAGSVLNKGVEVSLNATAIQNKNFSWRVQTNFALNRNKVISLADGLTQAKIGGVLLTSLYAEVGQPIGVMRGEDNAHDAEGNTIIDPSSGYPYISNLPFTTTGSNQAYLGNYQPKMLTSFGSTFTYKQFDFSFLLNARFGGQIFSGTYWRADINGVTNQTLENRDTYEYSNVILGEAGNPITKNQTSAYGYAYPDGGRSKGTRFEGYYPLVDASGKIVYDANGNLIADKSKPNSQFLQPAAYYARWNHINSLMIFDDSFIKLSQVIIGYTLPKSLLGGTFIKSAHVSLVGRNLWTILQHTPRGIDPESANSSGNAQGFELGGSLPYAFYGADLKFSF
ncbi:SusC/RagA family TonB-linked outer membrane protein [Mucilaginibacter sabulilitoris]|uniref:SusC/RagA family TonB-linked outer membrane protein n=1 Tax=Mucilaginibacter sabulilitoris TaxID=1173583 RepID=A0ABZ0TTI0_9SPHI|nr:SusC/RagA family TonB-linked outer membrane protein [Mucilaginibacter sabulilitoris]WPU94745.1 SusC/RagA family TonB-linked outer membrane protein [Mucilaginibacter sabulilitoris]